MLGVASMSTGHLCWEGGGVQAKDPFGGANDGHVAADALQMSVQPRQLRCHQLLHGVTKAGLSIYISGFNSQRTTAEGHDFVPLPIADNQYPRRGTPMKTDQSV